MISGLRQEDYYKAIQYINISEKYPIKKMCQKLRVNRAAYYKWLHREPSSRQLENEKIVEWIKELYEEQDGILGYRQMTITVNREHNVRYNKKRIRRLMQILHLKSVCRKKRYNYIKSTPEVTAENILNRDFHADKPNEKWLTDVTEFKYYVGADVKKVYLSAILDLYDRRIVSYKIGDSNNNPLVLDTFDEAVRSNPNAHPLFHSDRGFQYTSKIFHSNTQARYSTASLLPPICGRVCHASEDVLITVLWRASGESSSQRCIT